ncbi:alanine racemase [Daejeonella rubra]|uniref:Alanine racemase n=1 Tax=Daejeonella rubra TaxID=990371 RepID=A0A1G9XA32_9SPHI|nr:bifunctional UDP-N-acetylmuramoyl-tripeptide:D-alanyl-D-alanine ligase/alanine racemase [Daejeonella rubra]SDM93659.1 alanine racemase [Daejeonella rubra]
MNHLLYSVEELTEIFNARAFVRDRGSVIRTLLTDSRKLNDPAKGLFFALKSRRDGHSFISEVYKQGVRNFVISDPDFSILQFKDANFFLVQDTLMALQSLSASHRSRYDYPVIGITGSNGKTIVKEWLYQLLSPENNIIRSPKSFNSQIGVPVSVWEMNEEYDFAIFEAGISKSGEMENLAKIIRPTIGILTNIGEAHQIGFESNEEKISEKLKLFELADLFIYSGKYLHEFQGTLPGENKFTWSFYEKADLEIIKVESLDNKFQVLLAQYLGREIQAIIPFKDQASLENAVICWATMLALGYEPGEASIRLEKLIPIGMRLELKNGINNCSVIDDSYSLDLSSLAIALDFLKQQNQHPRRTLILSDIPGVDSELVYEKVRHLLVNKSVDRLIAVGEKIIKYVTDFPCEVELFKSTEDLLSQFSSLKFQNETVLLKGARTFGFEDISQLLTQKVHETVLEINLNALEHNLNYYKSEIGTGTKIMAMVKAFSYGSGSFEIANLLEFNKVDYLAVAYADEGVALRKAGSSLPIMVMSPDARAFDTIIKHELEPEIYSVRVLNEFEEVLKLKNLSNYPVHIKLDTGMHRLGFMEEELDQLLSLLNGNKLMHVQSVFSHLVASEDPEHDDFTSQQISLFIKLSDKIREGLGYSFIRHLANSSGISRWPDARFEMVRLGIGLYGIDSAFGNKSPLQTVTSLKTSISQIKKIPAGDTVGYSREGKMPDGGTIATVKIGYADGYNRGLGNGKGKMLVRGNIVPTIGKICMDMCMIDITGINAEEGDEVVVFNDVIRVEDIAKQLNTIPYEVLTGISQRVKRIYYYE